LALGVPDFHDQTWHKGLAAEDAAEIDAIRSGRVRWKTKENAEKNEEEALTLWMEFVESKIIHLPGAGIWYEVRVMDGWM
jgi:hypothetical protein